LNWTLDGVTLVPTWRKPFDVLAQSRREESPWVFTHQLNSFSQAVAELTPEALALIEAARKEVQHALAA
jgi:hypothetical protein